MEAMTASLSVPEEQKGDFRTLFEAIYGKADYTVGEAEKQEDDSYVVTVTYRPMELFSQVETQLMDEVNNLTESYMEQAMNGGEVPDEETLTLEILQLYKDLTNTQLENLTYGEEQTCQIRIELNDKVYTPNTDDLITLENGILGVSV